MKTNAQYLDYSKKIIDDFFNDKKFQQKVKVYVAAETLKLIAYAKLDFFSSLFTSFIKYDDNKKYNKTLSSKRKGKGKK